LIYIYFNDKNGTIYSADKQRCFSVVFGDDVYAFLRSEKNKEKRFYRTQTEETGGDMVLIEVPPEKVRAVRKEERRKQYVSDCMKNKEFTILHLGDMDSDDGITGEELIASLDESVDTLAIRNLDVSTLRKALIDRLTDILENQPMQFNDELVRQMLQCVVVESKDRIKVIFNDGTEIDQPVQ
jgi:hypothetical protein